MKAKPKQWIVVILSPVVVKQVRSTASDGGVGASINSAIAGFGLERMRNQREP